MKPAELPRWLGRFLCSEFGKEGRVVIFQQKVARPRSEVVRAGWNDAAWGRPHRQVDRALAQSYESGYAGGLDFREKQQADLLERAVVSRPLPRAHPQPEPQHRHTTTCTDPAREDSGSWLGKEQLSAWEF